MPKYWEKPIYVIKNRTGDDITIDVTSSVSAGLPPSMVLTQQIIPFLKRRKIKTIIDFGAGALRHTVPLLDAGFQVCAVEFEECYARPASKKVQENVIKHANFSKLIWPKQFIQDNRKFDAALLIYVLQIMPVPGERVAVIKNLKKKLKDDAYLFYASRFGQITSEDSKHRISDGYYRWPSRKVHSFYREFTTEDTHKLFKQFKFAPIRNLSSGGSEQMLLYSKGKGTWI